MNLLIDGSSLIHRVHWINSKNPMTASNGRAVGDIFMFLRSLKSYVKMFDTTTVYMCWDKKLVYPSTNFRHELTGKEYKAHRDKEAAKDVYNNEEDLIIMLNCLGVKNMYPRIMEADDVIAWLSHTLDGPNMVISSDGDLLQLVSHNTSFYHPFKKKVIDLENFEKEVGINKNAYLFYKVIKGDQSDNISGWEGYGKVRAKKAAEQIATKLESIYQYSKEQKIIFERNLRLMNLEQGYYAAGPEEVKSYQAQLEALINIDVDLNKFKFYCERFEFAQFLNKFNEWENLFKGSRLLSVLNNMFS